MRTFCRTLRRVEFREFIRQWIGVLLVLLGLARAAVVVLHDPMAGYANQGDMRGTSACVGLFPAGDNVPPATPEAPISRYKLDSRTDGCSMGAEVAIVATTLAIARATGADSSRIRLQWIGYVKLAMLFGVAFVIAWLLRDHPAAAAMNGVVVLLVLADPVVTLWMNTLYADFATIWSLYVVIASACVLALYDRQSLLSWALLIIGLVVLAVSREQFALLPVAMVLAAWPWLWHSSSRLTVATLVITLAASFVGLFVLPRPQQVAMASRTNTYLHLIAPASSSSTRALATLGLPDACEPLIGASWQRQRGESVEKQCPQVFALSRFAFVKTASDEPMALARVAARALPAMQATGVPYLGVLEGERGKTVDDLPWWAFSPLRALDTMLPGSVFAALALATFLLVPAGLVLLIVMRRYRGDPLTPLLLALLLGGTALYAFLTAWLGAGMNEAARNFLPGTLAMWTVLILAIGGLATLALRWKESPKGAMLEAGAGLAVIAIAGYASFLALGWAAAQPRAVGALDQPAARQVSAGGVELRGWALDPSGVQSVKVRVGTLEREAKLSEPSPATGLQRVASVYATYPDRDRAGFVLALSRDDLAQAGAPNPLTLRVLVQGANGAVTEIDRRNLVFLP